MITRRKFIDGAMTGAASLAIASTAKSYGQILGANDRLNFAVIGLNSRAYAHLSSLKANKAKARISHVCDVDSVILAKFANRSRLPQNPGAQGCRRHHHCDAGPLARPHGDRRGAGRQARLCRKAL